MKTFSNQEVTEYYDRTAIHYERAWDLNRSFALHYGFWNDHTQSFRQSLKQMNEELANFAALHSGESVLDAGCGIGGSCLYLATAYECQVKGITLSEQQMSRATALAQETGMSDRVSYQTADYCEMPFSDNTFDLVWTMESIVHTPDKDRFLREAYRVLKPGGRLVMAEYVKVDRLLSAKEEDFLCKWLNAWAISDLDPMSIYEAGARAAGFADICFRDITDHIRRSSWRMYYGSFFLRFLSAGYRLYNPKVSYFADNHYKGLYYQYPSLRRGLWRYYFIKCSK